MLTPEQCRQARLSRDARFDGLFFTAVKSTGIYCRPVCPARAPKEEHVEYFSSASNALAAGYRPCLRCRPDSAPGSPAWQGRDTTLQRALRLIDEGALQQQTLAELSNRLGISERYLRKLFQQQLGISPKQYALTQQVLFAKQLLYETSLPVYQVAGMAGFNSIRRFNDAFARTLHITPGKIRRQPAAASDGLIQLELSYRPPFAWSTMLGFWQRRAVNGVEWCTKHSYGRTFEWQQQQGWFTVQAGNGNSLQLQLYWPAGKELWSLIKHIRRVLDLDADCHLIEQQLLAHPWFRQGIISGLRIPGIWSIWEAGVRAILGQQVSVAAARTHLNRLVSALGAPIEASSDKVVFPSPAAVAGSDLLMLKLPDARRHTLRSFAQLMLEQPDCPPQQWLTIKGIGPWTVNYASMRGQQQTDIWLAGDLGIRKAMQQQSGDASDFTLAPWRSYATLQLWLQ